MNLVIVNQTRRRVPRQHLGRLLRLAAQALIQKGNLSLSDQDKQLTLVFLNRTKARKLNFRFRHKDYATDVLSFESLEPDSLGELIFCPEVLHKQAREHGLSYRDELAYMTLHGLLHLLGYEHERGGRQAKRMYQLQDQIFQDFLSTF